MPDKAKMNIHKLAHDAGLSLEFFQSKKVKNQYKLENVEVEFDKGTFLWNEV